MQGTHDGSATFIADGAIGRNVRVFIDTDSTGSPAQCKVAGATDSAIGVSEYGVADGEEVAVRLYGAGTMHITASGVIAQGAPVFGDAAGKISATDAAPSSQVGVALEAAAADGDIIHVAAHGMEGST